MLILSPKNLPPPVIVLGMHRSGTSVLAELLQACGLFIGRRYDHHFETPFFQRLNMACLESAGATWFRPEPYLERHDSDPEFVRQCQSLLERRVNTLFARKFLGWRHALGVQEPRVSAWGWKDPRTCLTLDLWLPLFPGARLLHVVRHPLDVAISLERREHQRRKEGRTPVEESLDLDHGLRLWETYVEACRRFRGENAYHEIRYETLMADPEGELAKLLPFCGLDTPAEQLHAAAGIADGTRTRRFDDARYAPWLDRLSGMPLAREFGYA